MIPFFGIIDLKSLLNRSYLGQIRFYFNTNIGGEVKKRGLILWIVICAVLLSSSNKKNPEIVYLTYTKDPTTSITVQWHSPLTNAASKVLYRKKGEVIWQEAKGSSIRPEEFEMLIHRVDLGDLQPNTFYEFRVDSFKKTSLFRTLSSDVKQKPVQFVVGGDAYRFLSSFRKANRQIAETDPDFVIVGGDIAYTHSNKVPFKGRQWEIKRWTTFFSEWKTSLVGKGGRMIPIVPVVGNHDVPKNQVDPRKTPVLLYQLFAFGEENISYRALDIGSFLSLILLDTDHSYPIIGDQTQWLKQALSDRAQVSYKFAVYHVGAYPSVYPYNGAIPKRIRKYWSPLFEANGVQVAFEHHNHAYKRTYPIKAEQIDSNGVIYIGDGCWGVKPRKPHPKAWYLAEKDRKNCFNFVSISDQGCDITAYAITGEVIDKAPRITR